MNSGPLFNRLLHCRKKYIVCQGGGDAGKTVTILQYLATRAVEEAGVIITVTAIDLPNLKRGALRQFKKYVAVDPYIAPAIAQYNKGDCTYHFLNGSLIEFRSFGDEDDARGSERDYLFVNEAPNVGYKLFWQLKRKTRKKVIIDYNPTYKFWAHHKLLSNAAKASTEYGGRVQLYIMDHRHNPFLSQEDHDAYENMDDPEQFRVYARGLTGAIKGTIYKWKQCSEIPPGLPFGFGVDFGYTSDPTAIVKIYYDKKTRYVEELLYMPEDAVLDILIKSGSKQSTAQYYADVLKKAGCRRDSIIWGDHDKNMAVKLRREGIPYRMAKKGPNSVTAGISATKRNQVFIYKSPNITREMGTYVWETVIDVTTGNEVTTNQPKKDVPEHALDAIRYFETSFTLRYHQDPANEGGETEDVD